MVHLPKGTAHGARIPVIVSFHPMALTPVLWCKQQSFNPLADREGFAVVYPQGHVAAESVSAVFSWWPTKWFAGGWTWNGGSCCPGATRAKVDVVQFTRD